MYRLARAIWAGRPAYIWLDDIARLSAGAALIAQHSISNTSVTIHQRTTSFARNNWPSSPQSSPQSHYHQPHHPHASPLPLPLPSPPPTSLSHPSNTPTPSGDASTQATMSQPLSVASDISLQSSLSGSTSILPSPNVLASPTSISSTSTTVTSTSATGSGVESRSTMLVEDIVMTPRKPTLIAAAAAERKFAPRQRRVPVGPVDRFANFAVIGARYSKRHYYHIPSLIDSS
jgi:hypothetical protein